MKIKDVFQEIIVGYNLNNATMNDKYSRFYKTLQKDSIQYTNIIPERFIEKKFSSEIKKKYFLVERDIIIFVKSPYRVGTYTHIDLPEVVIPNNFIILRGIDMDLYSFVFVANYLEKIGLKKFVEENSFHGNLSIEYIKDLELPNIPKEEQLKISPLLKAINNRSAMYSKILANDEKIALYALNSVLGESYDR